MCRYPALMDDLRSGKRLLILIALDSALQRRAELLQAVWDSADDAEAVVRVSQLLGCDETAAQAVLDMSWGRATKQGRERTARERDELRPGGYVPLPAVELVAGISDCQP